ncbi:unnamed protein product [Cylindrotheca closterium]|uniref:Thioredoxin domain-containing protein n=1 Tax=Cylindrotheca closterium TaxID=2856 RepID=A0AAD2PUJ6_9STRA|nr:unnamed protein product [Cylindrotheca closterium]
MVHPLILPMALLAKSSMVSQTSRCAWMRSSSSYTALSASSKQLSFPVMDPSSGKEIECDSSDAIFQNKRVALYFSAGWCPMCTRAFEPSLETFRQACEESDKPVEFLYVSSDKDANTATERATALNMKMVPFGESCAKLKKDYEIWAGSEAMQFGFGRRSGVPAIVVLDKTGQELAFLPAEAQGPKALASWPMDDETGIWGA